MDTLTPLLPVISLILLIALGALAAIFGADSRSWDDARPRWPAQ